MPATEPLAWLSACGAVFQREVAGIRHNLQLVIFCFCLPVAWLLVIWALLGQGVVTHAPVAFTDYDNTPLSRETARAIAACRSVKLESWPDAQSALAAMQAGTVYGVLLIPAGYERDKLAGRNASVVLWTDENRYAVATMLRAETGEAIRSLDNQTLFRDALATGIGPAGAKRLLSVIHSDFYALGNAESSFLAFLGSTLIPSLIMLSAMLGFVTAFLRELWHNSVASWLSTAGDHLSAAVCGKLLPYFGIYALIYLFYLALFSGQGGFNITGSLWTLSALGLACLADFAAAAIIVAAISPSWRLALVMTAGYAAPALPFTGFSMPLDSMGRAADIFSHCLPLTWYIQGQAQLWTLGASLSEMGKTFAGQAAIFLLLIALGFPLLGFFWRKRAQRETGA